MRQSIHTCDQTIVTGIVQERSVHGRREETRALHLLSGLYLGAAMRCRMAVKRLLMALSANTTTSRPATSRVADVDSMFAWRPVRRSPAIARVS